MSGFGGFGFGQNNNNNQQQQQSTFSGFGQNNQQQSTGFGSSGGFGSTNTNTGGGLFGNTSGGFGTGGGFGGSNNSGGFGAPKPFGTTPSTSGGGLFGSTNTATSGGFGTGGFGTTTNNNTGGFGNTSTSGGGLFGNTKPAFGGTTSTGTTGGSLFGGGGSTGGFGTGTQTGTGGFGTSAGGFGTAAAQPNQNNGTGNVQFEAHREKEGATTSVFNSITMQPAYNQFSFEELRVADYQQGRKYGNSNGQAGAFGSSTFGGFGTTNNSSSTASGGLFGNNNNQQQSTGTGFGGTSGGLFGAKPATGGGLFGNTATTSAPSGGLFGSGPTNAGTGFGTGTGATSTGFGSGTTGGGLFGSTQNKPAFGGGFGGTSTGSTFGQSTGTTGFGQTTTSGAGGGLFGSGGASSFNQNNNTGTGFGSGFGTNNQPQQNQTGGGLFGSGGGFGTSTQQQNKPSLFGSTQPATGGGLFGSQPQPPQQQSGGLFGNSTNNQQQSGGLFGNKPATTGGSLFGNTNTTSNTGGGLFGNLGQQNQTNTGGGLFGSSTSNQQQKPSLFGNMGQSTASNTSGGLFGNLGQSTNNQPQQGSLFGSTQQPQQQQSGGLFSSMNQSQQMQPQQPPQLTASLLGVNPYGNDQLFASLGASTPSPGPIATPLSGQPNKRKPAILPQHKINPLAASRLITPQKKTGGFGFSYSTYGTPGSAIGTPTGFSNSLLTGGSLGRSLSKSFSASNLRNMYNSSGESNVAPGLFTSRGGQYGSGNMKRLSINRNLDTRRSLFPDDDDTTPRKRVLFEDSTPNGNPSANGTLNDTSGALVRTEEDESPRSTTAEIIETTDNTNGATNGSLSSVPEEAQAVQPPAASRADAAKEHARRMQIDQNPGDYWSRPSMRELQGMSRHELKHVRLVVGRDGIGQIDFGEVDLSDTQLDRLLGKIICLEMRHATVYGDKSDMQKPSRGKALNVPSEITLENSWPRKNAGKGAVYEKQGAQLDKHITRLKRVAGTQYVGYDANNGAWTFKVDHYTTYGLDYDEEEDTMMSGAVQAEASDQNVFAVAAEETPQDDTMADGQESSPDDTFDFRQGKPRRHMAGNFDEEEGFDYEDEEEMEEVYDSNENTQQSFLDDGSVGPLVVREEDEDDINGYTSEDREEMAGTFPVQPTEPVEESPVRPKSILKNSQLGRSRLDTPSRNRLVLESNWTEQLQRTASPRKQTRQALRESQAPVSQVIVEEPSTLKQLVSKKGPTSTFDLMSSLWGGKTNTKTSSDGKKQTADGKGFQWPYAKRAKADDAFAGMNETEKSFRKTLKPSWGPDGRLVYATPADVPLLTSGTLLNVDDSIIGEHADIRFAKFAVPKDLLPETLNLQQQHSEVLPDKDGAPQAVARSDVTFKELAGKVDASTRDGQQEQAIWNLASVLFDDLPVDEYDDSMPAEERSAFLARRRKDALAAFWRDLVKRDADKSIFQARSSEEKAIQHLASGSVSNACKELMVGGNFKLATLVSQIQGSDAKVREQMRKQIEHWSKIDSLSEMSGTVRALYEIFAGNTGEVPGKGGHRENQIQGFSISQRFGLDWKRAFGLRLWYETLASGGIEDAVLAYQFALDQGSEKVMPVPSFINGEAENGNRRDLLWVLLRLYAAQQSPDIHVRLESVFDPADVSDNPIDARLCWQLLQIFRAKGIEGSIRQDENADDTSSLDLASDTLTTTYASALISALPSAPVEQQPHLLFTALFGLSHLSNPSFRRTAIQDLLFQSAPLLISDDELTLPLPQASGSTTKKAKKGPRTSSIRANTLADILTNDPGLSIPHAWLATALALWAKAVDNNPAAEARHLLEAGQINDAHAVLLHHIGPSCIVKRNYDTLREVLGGFEGKSKNVTGWRTGGGVYFDYIHLLDLEGNRDPSSSQQRHDTITRLVEGLGVMGREIGKDASVEERAAVWEMGRVVAEKAGKEKDVEGSKVLGLPMMDDEGSKRRRELSLGYYRALMAGGH